jgi:glycosyltransferase involved in cell wall biosynthesis
MNLLRSVIPHPLRRKYHEQVRQWKDRLRGETAETYFDLHNSEELDPVLLACGVEPLRFDPTAMTDRAEAIRFILSLVSSNPRIRRWFPEALSAGPDGRFARWLTTTGAIRFGLPETARDCLAATFAAYPGEKGKRVYEIRADLRTAFPFGLTPRGRGEFLGWLLRHGTHDLGFTPEEALWFLFESDEWPDRGLAATYLVRPDWQERYPHALTAAGWMPFKRFLRTAYGLCGRWFERARCPKQFDRDEGRLLLRQARLGRRSRKMPTTTGVNVLGHFRYASGLQEAAAGLVTALGRTGVRTQRRDLPVIFPCDWTDRERYCGVELYGTSIVVAAVNTFPEKFFPEAGLYRRPGVYRIAFWYWELEDVPAEWVPRLGWADEVWAPTRFVADAFRKVVNVPVVEMLPGVELPSYAPLPKSHFGLKDDRFTFLFTFDMHSTAARKNPLGVIEAFRRSFRPAEPVDLVVKVSRGRSCPDDFAVLHQAASAIGAIVIDRVMPRAEVLGLMNAADCFVSLHRSEGLGLGLIESMVMGKPVIATAYSGNLDFMTEANSYLVRAGRVPVTAQTHAYPLGCVWGDPDLDHAAEQMRRVFDRREESRTVGERAKRDLETRMSMESYGRRVAARLRAVEVGRLNS